MTNRNCKGYCGVACIDGTFPKEIREQYAVRGYDIVDNCNECPYNNGCEDCCFNGTEMCEMSEA